MPGSVCLSCAAPLPAGAIACLQCGAMVEGAPLNVQVMRPRPAPRRRKPWAAVVAIAGTLVVGLGAALAWSAGQRAPLPATPTRPSATSAVSAVVPSDRFDADEAFDRARAEALRWSPDALLIRIEAGPFVGGRLTDDAKVRADFGKPGGAHAGPGAGLQREQLVITVTKAGLANVSRAAPGGVAVADPNCIFQDVWRKALGAVPEQAPLSLRYERSTDNRAIWKIMDQNAASPLRQIDGTSCTFLVR